MSNQIQSSNVKFFGFCLPAIACGIRRWQAGILVIELAFGFWHLDLKDYA